MLKDITEATQRAQALTAAGRVEEGLALHREIVAAFPNNTAALHNLAAALGDAGRWAEAYPVIRAALGAGLATAESWLVLARSLQAEGMLDEAETAYVFAVRLRPMADAHTELAQLRWMRGADIATALRDLDTALRQAPATDLLLAKGHALFEGGDRAGALSFLKAAVDAAPHDSALAARLAEIALAEGEFDLARESAERALALAPQSPAALFAKISVLLNDGEAEQASAQAARFREIAPRDQYAVALQATAWRALGDRRYRDLYDYDALLCVEELDTPPGWPSLAAYLADLAVALRGAHKFNRHPFGQTLRGGSLIHHVHRLDHPAAKALPAALDGPIRRYMKILGAGEDVLRVRNTGDYFFQNIWSVLMRPGAQHLAHAHAHAWISSAFYIEVPHAVANGREGWIKFGEPSMRVAPAQEAERFIAPRPGRLLMFPAYMWHGTIPFGGDEDRLTCAFDIAPR